MGKILIETEEDINLKIKAKDIDEAIKKLKQNKKLKKIEKFKGIGKKEYSLKKHKKDWYLQ